MNKVTLQNLKVFIKSCYYMLRKTYAFHIINVCANILFRHNNLLYALIKSKLFRNKIHLGKNVVLRHCKFVIHGTGNTIIIGDNCKLFGVRIYMNSGKNKISIGQNTIVNASKDQMTLFNPCNGGEISIGEKCLFSNNIEMHTTDYHKIIANGRRTNQPKNIRIGNHCWIGLQCLILKGTVLADNTIVGARSLVNKKIEESNVVVVGNPAQIVKQDISWDY